MRIIATLSDWVPTIFNLLVAVGIFLLIPCSVFRPTRRTAGVGFLALAALFAIILWFSAALSVYVFWGSFALVISALLMGIPTIIAGLVATSFSGTWNDLLGLAIMIVATLASALAGALISIKMNKNEQGAKVQTRRAEISPKELVASMPKTDALDAYKRAATVEHAK